MVIAAVICTAVSPVEVGETKLLFRAQVATIPAEKPIALGKVEVAFSSAIRVVTSLHPDFPTIATIQLILMEGGGALLNVFRHHRGPPKSTATRLYSVPGRQLLIEAASEGSAGSTTIDVIMYGTP